MAHRTRPSHAILTRFLRERHPRSVDEAAELIQWPAAPVRREAEEREALTADGLVRWDAAAQWLMDAWPLATLLDALGPDADLLPAGLHPVPLVLQQPAYLVRALRLQRRIERMPHRILPPRDFTEYMTDLLHRTLLPETVAALQRDAEFVLAYDFPGQPDDE